LLQIALKQQWDMAIYGFVSRVVHAMPPNFSIISTLSDMNAFSFPQTQVGHVVVNSERYPSLEKVPVTSQDSPH
jgi:hypothetical protein